MAKRFTSTEIWSEDWFLDMPSEYKLFWYYMLSTCDHAGVFKVNTKTFCKMNEVILTSSLALNYFNTEKQRVRVLSDNLWLIEDFFQYQYGEIFNPNNRVHDSIEKVYQRHNIEMTSIRGLKDLKDRVKDKDKDKDKDIKKGGMGENKKGVKFDDDLEFVYFDDGSKQKLGSDQKALAKLGKTKPHLIVKGSIY